MERIFKEHFLRSKELLNGDWRFCPDKHNVGIEEKWFESFPENFRYANVPSCWNLELDLHDYFGVAWYSKDFYCEECYLSVEFGAVTGLTRVYLDGEELGEHYGGWTAFDFAKKVSGGKHTLTVRVDASSNDLNTIPLQHVDWYHNGGIIRSVEISKYSHAYIKNHRVSYELDDELKNAEVTASCVIFNPFESDEEIDLNFRVGDACLSERVSVPAGQCLEYEKKIAFENVTLWDIGAPKLYDVVISTGTDDVIDKIGFRKIEAKDKKIYLNGKSIVFKGVNRHEEHPDWGFAVPANITKRDVDIIKNMNCNIIRGAHYPQSRTLLDYLDREGIMFWSEIPMWGFTKEALGDPLTLERGLTMHSEMVDQYFHHPSIVIWGLHNEVDTGSKEAYDLTKKFSELIRGKDGSRLITFATDKFFDDICLEFADFVSLNYYYGWYGGTLEKWEPFIKGVRDLMIKKGVGDKPVVMSEFGCAAMQGFDDFGHDKWTMQYQGKFLKTVIDLAFATDGFCGTFVWQFADTTSDVNINRARGFNNKGIVTEHRRPKSAYFTVKELYE